MFISFFVDSKTSVLDLFDASSSGVVQKCGQKYIDIRGVCSGLGAKEGSGFGVKGFFQCSGFTSHDDLFAG
jgi:hypothetical protein